jgi:hypothetical protein
LQHYQANLSENVIVEKIRNNLGRYSLRADNLIELSRQGVPDKVILAMQAKQSAPSGAAAGGAASRQRDAASSSNPLDSETNEVAKAFWLKILPRLWRLPLLRRIGVGDSHSGQGWGGSGGQRVDRMRRGLRSPDTAYRFPTQTMQTVLKRRPKYL